MKIENGYFSKRDHRLDEEITKKMNQEFPLPEQVEIAKRQAFAQVKEKRLKQDYANDLANRTRSQKKIRGLVFKSLSGLTAAAAVFGVVCIANPALAAQIPLVGHVFEKIGGSLGYSGDYEKYVTPLQSETESEPVSAVVDHTDTSFSKTVDGVTVTLSEVYCNEYALNVGILIESEETFPETRLDQFGKYMMYIDETDIICSYNERNALLGPKLEGELVDEHTFVGVMRMDLTYSGYVSEDESYIEIPDEFSVKISIPQIVGYKAESETPKIPQELWDEYHAGLAEHGLDYDDYESFTDEEKELDRQLMQEMYRKYEEMYPGVMDRVNDYENWWVDGPWEFEVDVQVNHEDTIVKEINDTDENGLGIASVTKTPFELAVKTIAEPAYDYFTVALDANGDILPYGGSSSTSIWAIQDRDISRVDIYICDYVEYLDELKGYYWSEDYEENSKTKTFKQLLDERALHHTEVTFE